MNKYDYRRKKRAARKKRQSRRKKRALERNQISNQIINGIELEINQSNYLEVWNKITEKIKGKKLKKILGKKFTAILNKKNIDFDKNVFVFPETKKTSKKKELKVDKIKISSTNAYDSEQKFKGIIYNRPKS